MSIDRAPSGKYRVRFRGAPSKSFDRLGDAQTYEREAKRLKQVGRLDSLHTGQMTLAALASEHMRAERARLADSTWSTYRSLWSAHVDERILDADARTQVHAIAEMAIRDIRPRTIEQWRDDRLSDGAGPHAVRKTMALMQSIFGRAIRDGSIDSNPVAAVKKPSGKRTGTVAVVAPAGVEQVRRQLGDGAATFVSVLAYAGLRPGEARALRWEHVGTKSLRVELGTNPDGTVKATKTEQMRSVPLVAPLIDDLTAWRGKQGNPPDDAHIFPRADGLAWTLDDFNNWRNRTFKPAVATAKVKIGRPYDLRHSIASLWLQAGVSPVRVAAWLGHNVATTFATYAHVVADLDADDRTPVANAIAAARQDTSRTRQGVQRRSTGVKRKSRKARSRAKSEQLA